ncbi:MAG: hypothetical protein M3Y50_02215 [Acidobacteriota bacterium]|nr:hypothetical protein [Acidobacteriota bacterium]
MPARPVYAAASQPVIPRSSRVQQHLQTLGILWCVFGVYRVVGGLLGVFVLRVITLRNFGGGWPFGPNLGGSFSHGPAWLGGLVPLIAIYTIVGVALSLLVGFSLLTRQSWGRTFALVVGILTLFKPIFGTALGVYTLWVLSPSLSGLEYEAMADRS